jgi:nucleoside-diphosphate-sugar epimerase
MKRVLITGADGFTGRYLTAALEHAGHEVHGVVRELPPDPVSGLAIAHVCDLNDAAGLADLVNRVQPHRAAHLAAIAFVAHGDAEAIYRTNIMGTRNLLEALTKLDYTPDSVLLASSANVYGNATVGTLNESSAVAPANDYAVSKLAMEYVARLYRTRLPLVISRPFNYSGVGQAENFLLPKIVSHVRRSESVIELGNLDIERDFSDVRMVAEAYRRLLQTPEAAGETFNICSGKAHTLRQVLALVSEISGRKFEVRVNPAFVRDSEVKTLLGSRTKLDACVGPMDEIELGSTLRWMLDAPAPMTETQAR